MDSKGHSDEISDGNEEYDTRNWKKGILSQSGKEPG